MPIDRPTLENELDALPDIELPGRGGELRRSGDFASLVTELGRRYDLYHGALARQLNALGPEPKPSDYMAKYGPGEGLTRLGRDVARFQRIRRAEEVLRRARLATMANIAFEAVAPEMMLTAMQAPIVTPAGALNSQDANAAAPAPPPATSSKPDPKLAAIWPVPLA